MENGDLTTTTNLADQCIHTSILPSIRMPLLNVNYKEEINNRINNSGIVLNGSVGSSCGNASVMSQLSNVNESWKKYLREFFISIFIVVINFEV